METLKLKTYIAALVVCAVIFLAIPAAYADLLVMSNPTQQVLRYDETTGAFIDVFASPAVIPSICGPPTTVRPFNGIAYGPDGNLYVVGASSVGGGSGAVLRYDGRTGAFIDVFALPALVNFPSQGSATSGVRMSGGAGSASGADAPAAAVAAGEGSGDGLMVQGLPLVKPPGPPTN